MRAFEILTEGLLAPGELFVNKHLDWRPAAFLQKLKDRTPFVDSLDPKTAKQYIPAKGEYQRLKPEVDRVVAAKLKDPTFKPPSLVLNLDDGGSIAVSKLEKADLQSPTGQKSSKINVQPIGIKIAADKVDKNVSTEDEVKLAIQSNKTIVSSNLANVISSNKIVKSAGILGKGIIKCVKEITAGQVPNIAEFDEKTQNTLAIDAGEYLGILQMVHGTANFPKKDAFLNFLETPNLDNMMIVFPGRQNGELGDSYGVQNPKTGHSIMISSKGGKGRTANGAAPAISGLKIPESMLANSKPGSGVEFLKILQQSPVVLQPFKAWNFLAQYYPETIPPIYQKVLPFTDTDMQLIVANIKGKAKLPAKYNKIIATKNVKKATQGGILFYSAAKDLVSIVNAKATIPDLRQTILEILDLNFVQIFSRVVGGKLTADVLWPGKVDGTVLLWTKAEAAAPSSAGFSFKVTD